MQQSFAVGARRADDQLHVDAARRAPRRRPGLHGVARRRPPASRSRSRADAASAGVCTVSGSTVSLVGAGTCTSTRTRPATATHQAAPQVQQSFAVGRPARRRASQSISFTSTAPAGATVGGADLHGDGDRELRPSGRVLGRRGSAGVCTVVGLDGRRSSARVPARSTRTRPATASYQAAPQVQQSFAVGLATQTISFTSTPPAGAFAGGAGYTVTATATSGLAVAFTHRRRAARASARSPARSVSFVGGGTCTINANQAGNGSYQAAPQAQQSFTVAASPPPKSPQTINFTSTAPAGATVGGPTYTVTATASSGLAVAFSAAAGSAGICTVSGSTVSLVGAGTCTINANQAGNGSYLRGAADAAVVHDRQASQTISFTSTPPGSAVVGGAAYTVTATATSGLRSSSPPHPVARASARSPARRSRSSAPARARSTRTRPATATLPGGAAGAAVVHRRPRLADDHDHLDAAGNNVHNHDPPYTITATATSGLAVVFTTDPSSAGVCSVSGSTVTFSRQGRSASSTPISRATRTGCRRPRPSSRSGSNRPQATASPPAGGDRLPAQRRSRQEIYATFAAVPPRSFDPDPGRPVRRSCSSP